MQITVNMFSGLEKYSPSGKRKGNFIELADTANIDDLLVRLGVPEQEVQLIMVDGIHRGKDYTLQAGDTVALFPLLGGG